MIKEIILGTVALAILIAAVSFPHDIAVADGRDNNPEILTKDYVFIGAESEDGVSITIAPPSEEIMNAYR
ncbi:MAG: hypothetical protein GY771_15510 [bacterium]|nr:hypothetical protein [bacterium]